MPSGLGNFIKQSHAPNPVGRRELDRRSNLDDLKINRESVYGVTPRWGLPTPQPPSGHGQVEEDLFAGSVLDESDDTARDIDIRGNLRNQRVQHVGDRPAGDVGAVENESDDRYDDGHRNGGTNRYFGNEDGQRGDDRAYDGTGAQGRQLERGFLPSSNPQADVVVQQFQEIKNGPAYSAAVKIYEARTVDTRTPFIGRFQAIPPPPLGQPSIGGGQNAVERNGRMAKGKVANLEHDGTPLGGLQGKSDSYAPGRQLSLRKNTNGRDRLIAEMDRDETDNEDAGSEMDESTVHSSPSEPTPQAVARRREHSLGSNKRHPLVEVDYDETTLSKMKYSELKDQPFDTNPKAPSSVVPENLQSPESSLDERLHHFASQSSDHQHRLFEEMSMSQWEECGDWFLGRFGNIMSKLKDARKAKRDISKAFEEELARREEGVRGKAENIQEVMKQMRAGGEGVLRGRTP